MATDFALPFAKIVEFVIQVEDQRGQYDGLSPKNKLNLGVSGPFFGRHTSATYCLLLY